MKLTIPALTLSIGGAQRVLAQLANGLAARGHDVTVLMPRNGSIEYEMSVPVVRTSDPYEVKAPDYPEGDLIVSNFYQTVPPADEASQQGKGIHVRLSLCYEPTFLPEHERSFPTYQLTPHLIALSSWQQKVIKLNHGIEGHVIGVGLSPAFRNLHWREQRAGTQPVRIAAIVRKPEGGFAWHRQQDYLLNALKRVKAQVPRAVITLACPPQELAESAVIRRLKQTGPFEVVSPENDEAMCQFYNRADIFVSSSIFDSAALPGLEAMKTGAALVTTYAGGNRDYCQPEKNCLMSYRYEEKLAGDVMRLIRQPQLRKQLAEEGEKEASSWTLQRMIDRYESVFVSLVQ